MLYVIPFVLLLVVLIVLKKREATQKDNTQKTAARKSTRPQRATQKPRTTTSVVAPQIEPEKKSQPLSAKLKQDIEQLITEKKFFDAEAKINQALNQDNAQHELYLYLLDVHLAQKDEFATKQLMNHLRSLGLTEILEQAVTRKDNDKDQHQPTDAIEFSPHHFTQTEATEKTNNNAAFDALVNTTTSSDNEPQHSLDTTSAAVTETEALTFSLDTAITTEQTDHTTSDASTDMPALEFNFSTPKTSPSDTTATAQPQEDQPAHEPTSLDFEHNFTFESNVEAETSAPNTAFKFESSEAVSTDPLNLDTNSSIPALEFEQNTVITQPAPTAELNLDTDLKSTTAIEAADVLPTHEQEIHQDDPLAQSFPEILQYNEIELNLALAAQYIELGAYAAANQLLEQDLNLYTNEQRLQSENLRHRIAS